MAPLRIRKTFSEFTLDLQIDLKRPCIPPPVVKVRKPSKTTVEVTFNTDTRINNNNNIFIFFRQGTCQLRQCLSTTFAVPLLLCRITVLHYLFQYPVERGIPVRQYNLSTVVVGYPSVTIVLIMSSPVF